MSRFRLLNHHRSHIVLPQKPKLDLALLVAVIILTLFGLLMVYDSSGIEAFNDFGDRFYLIKNQLIWVSLGLFSLGFFYITNYSILARLAIPILIFSLLLLVLVFIPGLGVSAGGAHRWLSIGSLTLQPAELIKFSTIIFLGTIFQKGVHLKPFLVLIGLVSFIVGVLQKDLGSVVVFNLIAFGVYFVAGGPIKHFIWLFLFGLMAAAGFIATSAYRIKRVLAFWDPFADPQGFTYHILQILIALGSGGFFGVGAGQSRQKFAYIPEVTTDSIFSVIGEEFGFLGGVFVIGLFVFIVVRGINIAENAPDGFSKLLAAGLTIWLGSQAIVNLASMVSLVPLTGVPLPFISYGGSAILANLVAVGILLNISKKSQS